MDVTSAQYVTDTKDGGNMCIIAVVDGQELVVSLDPANRHYAEIMRQVEAGTLTIQEAE